MPEDVIVNSPIKLDQFLKWSNIVSTGGQAKILIHDGEIKVNGITELRRGRVLKNGDQVQVNENENIHYRVCIKE